MQQADKEISKVREWLEERKRETKVTAKQEQIKFKELQKMKLQLKTDQLAKKNQNEGIYQASTNSVQASKLPELVIRKFDGSYMAWPRFWGQFIFGNYRQNKRCPDHEVHIV